MARKLLEKLWNWIKAWLSAAASSLRTDAEERVRAFFAPKKPESAEEARKRRARERETKKLAEGPMDLPFCFLVLLLTAIGLVMLLSASFPYAYYRTRNHDPAYYFVRQGLFALVGIAAMLIISRINYQRLRNVASLMLGGSIFLLILVIIAERIVILL